MVDYSERESVGRPLVSVVTPFYNAEEFLAECIESVLRQSYQNWEYILLNNRSTDRSREIASQYAAEDARVRVYTNESFLTQPQNYNRALTLISPESKYCKIVQADDWIFPECLAEMTKVAEGNPSTGLIGAYRIDDTKVNCDGLPYPSTVVPGRQLCRASLLGQYFVFGSATTLLIRSDIVRNRVPFYSEHSNHEDTEACYEILQNCDFGFVHQVLTFTRRENESISSSIRRHDPSYILDRLVAVKKYGPVFLTVDEYDALVKRTEYQYLRFLAKAVLARKDAQFWEYHRNSAKQVGYRVNRFVLAKHVIGRVSDLVLNPKMTAEKVFKKIFRQRHIVK